jgi:helicase
VLEIKQMFGRAGRPKYDTVGEAIAIAKGDSDKSKIMERYILGEPERIYSKLGLESALRKNILATIASEFIYNDESLKKFIDNTFFAYQGDAWSLDVQLENVTEFLENEGFILVTDDQIEATELGRRVSRLYIDPISAVRLKQALSAAEGQLEHITPISYLHAISGTPDMFQLYLRESDYRWLEPLVEDHKREFLIKPDQYESEYESFLSEFKTAWLLWDWISERSEERISLTYNIGPGDIRNRVDTSQWLIYAMSELARMLGHKTLSHGLITLNQRLRYGVKDDLLQLVSLRGIGRVRARNLFKYKYRTLDDLRAVEIKKLGAVPMIGKLVAMSIKEQLGDESVKDMIVEPGLETDIEEGIPENTKTLDNWNEQDAEPSSD